MSLDLKPIKIANGTSISSINLSSSKRLFATASSDNLLKIYNVMSGECLSTIGGSGSRFDHAYGINDCKWCFADQHIISCSDDKTIKLWDVETGKCIRTFCGHKGYVFSVKNHEYTGLIVSGSFDSTVKVWDVRQVNDANTLHSVHNHVSIHHSKSIAAHGDAVVSVDISTQHAHILSGSLDGTVRVWDMLTNHCLLTFHDSNKVPVSSCSYSENGKYVISSTLDSVHTLWSVDALKHPPSLTDKPSAVSSASTSTSAAAGAPGSDPAAIANARDRATAAAGYVCQHNCVDAGHGILRKYSGHVNKVYNIFTRITGMGQRGYICSGSEENEVVIWDINARSGMDGHKAGTWKHNTLLPVTRLVGHTAPVIALDVHINNQEELSIISGDLKGDICIWRKDTVTDTDTGIRDAVDMCI